MDLSASKQIYRTGIIMDVSGRYFEKKGVHCEENIFMELFRNFTVYAWKIFHVKFNMQKTSV